MNTIGYRSCYDEGKRCSETLFMDYHREHNIRIKIIRIFNTYGPKMAANDGRVVSNFILQALKNKSITIYGDGSQTRSFQYIDDLVAGLVKMMNSDDKILGPINIGNTNEISIKDLCDKIISLTKSNSTISYSNLPQDDPKMRKPDISKAVKILNWKPKIKIEKGLFDTIKYFKSI